MDLFCFGFAFVNMLWCDVVLLCCAFSGYGLCVQCVERIDRDKVIDIYYCGIAEIPCAIRDRNRDVVLLRT